jgi:serine/threonine protein kinase
MENVWPSLPPEQNHGKYRPIADLGQGGTANVYLAVARGPSDFNKLVVLKMLKRELADETDFRNMFLKEARLSARLNHPNVVQTNEVLMVGGRPVMVMEYLDGQPLSRIVARTRGHDALAEFPLAMHLSILNDLLTGLHYAHELTDYGGQPLGLVHRDMTPQNVFVSYDGRVCILDFGIAKLADCAKEAQTAAGVLKGKLRYMAPEQLMSNTVDRRADIYAVGVMLWEAATGQRLWQGLPETAVVQRVACNEIPSPRSVRREVSDELEYICMKALAHKPSDRYASAAELQTDLEAHLKQTPYPSRMLGKFVDRLFADERFRIRTLIEQQIAALASEPPDNGESLSDWSLPRARSSEAPSSITSQDGIDQDTRIEARGRRRSFFLGAFFFGALCTAALFWRLGSSTPPASASASTGTSSGATQKTLPLPVQPASAPAPRETVQVQPGIVEATGTAQPRGEVSLNVRVIPESAKIYLDNVLKKGNPYSTTVPASREEHIIRAEARGYNSESRVIRYNESSNLEIVLDEAKSTRDRRGHAAQAAAPAAAPTPKSESSECEVPYELDENGIRRIKRQCL